MSRLRHSAKPATLAVALLALWPTGAHACPGDGGGAPASVKTHFCATWDAAGDANLGSPLNDAHRWGNGWIRDFQGGAYGRGGILEGDGEGWAFVVASPYWDTYLAAGGAPGPLGHPTGDHVFGGHLHAGPNANTYMTFRGGVINSWAAGTFETHGAILTKWSSLGGVSGPVGRPLSNEGQTARVDGRYSLFEGGSIIYNPRVNGAFLVYGGILNKYAQLGYSEHPLGLPTSDRALNGVKGNEYQVFDGGVINQYDGNAYETHGAILDKWNQLGGANGPVGLPISDEGATARVAGRFSQFQGGNIYYNQALNQAFHVYGGILNKYLQLGYSNHALGLPSSDRAHNSRMGNDYQVFDGGVINQYDGNAFETHGAILSRWNHEGGANGPLGLPTTDEYPTATSPQGHTGAYSRFRHGIVNYVPFLNKTFLLKGAIGAKYGAVGFAASYLGLPTSEEFGNPKGRRQNFEGGFIQYAGGKARTDFELLLDEVAETDFRDDPPLEIETGNGGDHSGGAPVPTPPPPPAAPPAAPPPPYRFRALGDSVTAAFGYDDRGRELSGGQVLSCVLGDVAAASCQSPDQVAYPARFAARYGLSDWRNDAVSGSTPASWLGLEKKSDLSSKLQRMVADHPDLVVMTLGANPLLKSFLLGRATPCTFPGLFVVERTELCIAGELLANDLVRRLTAVYGRVLADPRTSLIVMRYHATNPHLKVQRDWQVKLLLAQVNGSIASAIKNVDAAKRDRIRLIDPGSFASHGCRDRDPWVLRADDCIHPNAQGHRQFAAAMDAGLTDDSIPFATVRTSKTVSLKSLAKSGIAVTAQANERAAVDMELVAGGSGGASASRRKQGVRVVAEAGGQIGPRRTRVRLRASRRAVLRLIRENGRSRLTLRVMVTDRAGNMSWGDGGVRLARQRASSGPRRQGRHRARPSG
jgi:uncharacterized protein with LGFP repeats/lysophospholipase L1-like esterase